MSDQHPDVIADMRYRTDITSPGDSSMTNRPSVMSGLEILPVPLAVSAALAAIVTEQQGDAKLLALEAELHALDDEIRRMSGDTGDRDLDEHPDYQKAEDRRFEVIDAVAATPARTQLGVAAKARALKTRSIEEDYISTGEIAASMADDVLRLHSALV